MVRSTRGEPGAMTEQTGAACAGASRGQFGAQALRQLFDLLQISAQILRQLPLCNLVNLLGNGLRKPGQFGRFLAQLCKFGGLALYFDRCLERAPPFLFRAVETWGHWTRFFLRAASQRTEKKANATK